MYCSIEANINNRGTKGSWYAQAMKWLNNNGLNIETCHTFHIVHHSQMMNVKKALGQDLWQLPKTKIKIHGCLESTCCNSVCKAMDKLGVSSHQLEIETKSAIHTAKA